MTDLISRDEVVGKLKKAYFDKNLQEAKNDPCVIDAMTDWAIRQVKNIPSYYPWHTGTPTEEGGMFLVYLKDGTYDIYEFNNDYERWDIGFKGVVAWQRIEPYKEEEK